MAKLSPADWKAVQAEFDRLVDLPPARRASAAAGSTLSPELQAEVQAMLAASDAPGMLDQPVAEVELSAEAYRSLPPGTRIGEFELGDLIGRGGMGEVYDAHRIGVDFRQRVAIKLLRPEAMAQAGLFDRERRLLAGLEHPGIARLIDGGMAPDGRAFMAMEFVDGLPITEDCKARGADLAERLRLFRAVCDAVSYAHARLVIHRDLKPSNIVVDDSGRVRLLDFGIAKLMDGAVPADATSAAATQIMVTPDYASPEQLANAPATIGTDVYALGVILYELLVGKGPWHSSQSSLPSIMRRMLNEDPEMPSKAASAASPVPGSAIAGDLDAIILKAMRRTAEERYSSVAALSDDVARHLAMQPVLAREGSARYMAGRFVRRYRWAVGATAAAIVAVLIGAGGIAWQARQTAIERDIALAEARRSESINRMLTVMFRETAASDAGEEATVKQMLDQTAQQLVNSVDTSARSATLITTLSDLYVNMEDSVAAETLLRAAMDKGIGKDDPVSMAQLRMRLASVAAALGKNDEMKPLLDAAEPVFRADPARYRYELVELNNARAQLLRRTGDVPGAIALLTANLPNAEIVYAENHRDLLTLYNNLLVYMVEANQLDAMPAVFRRADAAITRTGMQDSLQGLGIAQLKGMRLLRMDQPGEAAKIFEELAAKRRAIFGRSAGLAVEMLQLARARAAQGRYQDVRTILTEARPMAMEKLGPTALPTLVMGMTLAEAMAETGDTAGSARLLAELGDVVKPMPPVAPPVPMLARAEAVLALAEGRKATARDALGRAEAGFKAMGPAGETFLKGLVPLRQRIEAMR